MQTYPEARWLEVHSIPEKNMLALTDPEGLFEGAMLVPPLLYFIMQQLDGSRTIPELLAFFKSQSLDLDADELNLLLEQLEERLCLEGEKANEARRAMRVSFEEKKVRPAAHAGGVYPADEGELRPFLEQFFSSRERGAEEGAGITGQANSVGTESSTTNGRSLPEVTGQARAAAIAPAQDPRLLAGIVAPHIDFRRGNVAYAHAYAPLRLLEKPPTVFIVLGTSHQPLRKRFAISQKAYDTPYGPIEVDRPLAEALAKHCRQNFFEDELSHRQEHSIEFQAVMLGHTLGAKNVTFLPVLCGSVHDLIKKDPSQDAALQDFIGATKEAIRQDGREVCVIAGIDLAHVGPHFGDPVGPDDAAKATLEARDRATMLKACEGDAKAFFEDVAEGKNDRRICGFAPMYSFLQLVEGAKGSLSYYGQAITPPDSIVSFASALFTR